jgi:hypothetical protein
MSDKANAMMQVIRASKAFGVGSCSTVDECMEDKELLAQLSADLSNGMKPVKIVDFMADVEQACWENMGMYRWKKDHAVAIRELKEEVAKL